ncbi:MAG: hypothetical protein AAGJ82_00440 [Bacteroidota bacterium]
MVIANPIYDVVFKRLMENERVAKFFIGTIITQILHHTGTDPETREEIEKEQEAWRTVNAMLAPTKKAFQQAIEEIKEKDEALAQKDEALAQKEEKLAAQQRLIEELQRKLKDR